MINGPKQWNTKRNWFVMTSFFGKWAADGETSLGSWIFDSRLKLFNMISRCGTSRATWSMDQRCGIDWETGLHWQVCLASEQSRKKQAENSIFDSRLKMFNMILGCGTSRAIWPIDQRCGIDRETGLQWQVCLASEPPRQKTLTISLFRATFDSRRLDMFNIR